MNGRSLTEWCIGIVAYLCGLAIIFSIGVGLAERGMRYSGPAFLLALFAPWVSFQCLAMFAARRQWPGFVSWACTAIHAGVSLACALLGLLVEMNRRSPDYRVLGCMSLFGICLLLLFHSWVLRRMRRPSWWIAGNAPLFVTSIFVGGLAIILG